MIPTLNFVFTITIVGEWRSLSFFKVSNKTDCKSEIYRLCLFQCIPSRNTPSYGSDKENIHIIRIIYTLNSFQKLCACVLPQRMRVRLEF